MSSESNTKSVSGSAAEYSCIGLRSFCGDDGMIAFQGTSSGDVKTLVTMAAYAVADIARQTEEPARAFDAIFNTAAYALASKLDNDEAAYVWQPRCSFDEWRGEANG